jgi:hypothetical protein
VALLSALAAIALETQLARVLSLPLRSAALTRIVQIFNNVFESANAQIQSILHLCIVVCAYQIRIVKTAEHMAEIGSVPIHLDSKVAYVLLDVTPLRLVSHPEVRAQMHKSARLVWVLQFAKDFVRLLL